MEREGPGSPCPSAPNFPSNQGFSHDGAILALGNSAVMNGVYSCADTVCGYIRGTARWPLCVRALP